MKIVKQITVIALICCGQLLVAVKPMGVSQQTKKAIKEETKHINPNYINNATDEQLYHLFQVPGASNKNLKQADRDALLYKHKDIIDAAHKSFIMELQNFHSNEQGLNAENRLGEFYAEKIAPGIQRYSDKFESKK